MIHPDYIKIDAVKIFKALGRKVDQTLAELRQKYGVEVSRRSLFNWADDPRFEPDQSGDLILFNDPEAVRRKTESPAPGVDIPGFVKRNKEAILGATSNIDRMTKVLLKGLGKEQLEKLDTVEKLNAFVKLERLKTQKIGLLFDLIAQAGGEEEDILSLIKQVSAQLNEAPGGETIEATVVKEDGK